MKKAKEWADIYCCSEVPTTLEKLIQLVQIQAIEETIKACKKITVTTFEDIKLDSIMNELKLQI